MELRLFVKYVVLQELQLLIKGKRGRSNATTGDAERNCSFQLCSRCYRQIFFLVFIFVYFNLDANSTLATRRWSKASSLFALKLKYIETCWTSFRLLIKLLRLLNICGQNQEIRLIRWSSQIFMNYHPDRNRRQRVTRTVNRFCAPMIWFW